MEEPHVKIFFWEADTSGCSWYRCILPGVQLANRGHKVAVDGNMPQFVRDGDIDVIVAQRTCLPGPTVLWQQLARRKGRDFKLVFEIDDDLWNVEPNNRVAHDLYAKGMLRDDYGRVVEQDMPISRNLIDNVTVADVVTVSTEPLAELVSQWNPNVVVLPNMIEGWLLDQPMPQQQADRVTIGWAGGPSHARDFGEMAKPVKRVLQRFGDAAEFHCMGMDYTDRLRSHRGRTRHTAWADGVTDYLNALDFHIGTAPLRETTFSSAKSDLKLLEYAALGIPSVVSYTGPYARAIDAGAPARFAQDHKTWERALVAMVQSPTDREALGKEAREWAATRTIEGNAHLWEAAYL